MNPGKSEIVIYQTDDGKTRIDVRMENGTVWLTQAQMAELFQRERAVITKHINNAIAEGELDRKRNVQFLHIANSDKRVARAQLADELSDVEKAYLDTLKLMRKQLKGGGAA